MKSSARLAALSALTLAVAVSGGAARAQSDLAPKKHVANIKWTPGRVSFDGTVAEGDTFTADRIGTGDYTLTFSAKSFPKNPPILTCTAAGADSKLAICNVWAVKWDPGSATVVEIRLFALDGSALDNAFNFTEMTPQ